MHDFLVLIINILKRGMFLAIPVMLVCAVILAVVWIIFKKKKILVPWKKALVLLLLTGWAVLTVYATLFRIEAGFGAWNLHLFAAWREALNKFTLQVWLNVLLNIALFVPLGVLIPLLFKCFRRWYLALACGFGTSLVIEIIQLVSGRGMFDVDDLFTNTLGTMLGFGIVKAVIVTAERGTGWKRQCLCALSVPVAFSAAMAAVFLGYSLKPYGNIPDAPIIKANLDGIQWELEFVPDDTSAKAKVYAAGRLDKTASEEFVKSFADRVGIEFPDTYYYDDTIIFANHSTGDFLNINQRDGSWEYKIDTDTAPAFDVNASEIKPAELSGLLAEWGINIPEEAGFSVEPFGEGVKYTATFTSELVPDSEGLVYGEVICTLYEEDGKTLLKSIDNRMVSLSPCEDKTIINQAGAVKELRSGHSFEGTVLERSGVSQIKILSCKLDFMADTKGYYQPVYRFELLLPEEDDLIFTDYVQALK